MTDISKDDGAPRTGAPPAGHATEDDDVDRLVSEADRMSRRRPLLAGFVAGVVIAAAATVFIVQNTRTVDMEWLWFDFGARVWVSLAVAFLASALASPLILLGIAHIRHRRTKRRDMVQRVQRRRRSGKKVRTPT